MKQQLPKIDETGPIVYKSIPQPFINQGVSFWFPMSGKIILVAVTKFNIAIVISLGITSCLVPIKNSFGESGTFICVITGTILLRLLKCLLIIGHLQNLWKNVLVTFACFHHNSELLLRNEFALVFVIRAGLVSTMAKRPSYESGNPLHLRIIHQPL